MSPLWDSEIPLIQVPKFHEFPWQGHNWSDERLGPVDSTPLSQVPWVWGHGVSGSFQFHAASVPASSSLMFIYVYIVTFKYNLQLNLGK